MYGYLLNMTIIMVVMASNKLTLFVHGEVGVCVLWVDVLLVQVQHLVVADCTGVAEVVDT